MSIKVITHVWEHSAQRGSALLMLLAIADNANEDGEAWPAIPTLARKTRMTERNAQLLIHKLEAAGELAVQERSQGTKNETNLFTIPVPWRVKPAKSKRRVVKGTSPGGESDFTRGGEKSFTRVVKAASPKPSLEPSLEPSMNHTAPDGAKPKSSKGYEGVAHEIRTAIIEAWQKNLSAPPIGGNPYGNTNNHKLAAAIARAGYTAADVARYTLAMQSESFWHDKALKLQHIASNLPVWIKAHPAPAATAVPAVPPPEGDVVSPEKQEEARQLFERLVAAHNANTVRGDDHGKH